FLCSLNGHRQCVVFVDWLETVSQPIKTCHKQINRKLVYFPVEQITHSWLCEAQLFCRLNLLPVIVVYNISNYDHQVSASLQLVRFFLTVRNHFKNVAVSNRRHSLSPHSKYQYWYISKPEKIYKHWYILFIDLSQHCLITPLGCSHCFAVNAAGCLGK